MAATETKKSSMETAKNATTGVGLPLYRRLSALGADPEGSVKNTMNKWLREGKSIRAREIVTYVKELRRYKRFEHALELLEWMDMKGMNMTYGNHAIRVDLLSKTRGVDSAEKYFNNLSDPARNQRTYGALLNIYCVNKMEDKAMEVYEKMKQMDYISGSSGTLVYNHLVGLFNKTSQYQRALSVLEEMKANNIERDHFTYNMMISIHSSLGDIDAIDKILQDIVLEDVSSLHWDIFGSAASIYISAGHIEKAESSIKKLEEIMDTKDRLAYHFLITLYGRLGKKDEVIRIWKSLVDKIKTNNKSYLILFQSLYKLNDLDTLQNYFEEWNSSYQSYDIRLVNVIIRAYLKNDMVQKAKSLLESSPGKGKEADHRTYDLFIGYYLGKNEICSALKYFHDAASVLKDWSPQQELLDAFNKYFTEIEDEAGAQAFRESLKIVKCEDYSLKEKPISNPKI